MKNLTTFEEGSLIKFRETFGKNKYLLSSMESFKKGDWKKSEEIEIFLITALREQRIEIVKMLEKEVDELNRQNAREIFYFHCKNCKKPCKLYSTMMNAQRKEDRGYPKDRRAPSFR